jgi:hypothetical protein
MKFSFAAAMLLSFGNGVRTTLALVRKTRSQEFLLYPRNIPHPKIVLF